MKFIILLIAVATSSFSLFAQELNMDNVQNGMKSKRIKAKKEFQPLEISFGYGRYFDVSDSLIWITTFNPTFIDTVMFETYAIDTIGIFNNQVNLDFSKQIGSWRFGISTNYMFKSSDINGYRKDFTNDLGPFIDKCTVLDSKSSYDLQSYRLNFFADFLVVDRSKFSIYLGGGFGYMNKTFSNLTFQNQIFEGYDVNTFETIVAYEAWEADRIYKLSSSLLTSKVGYSYHISSKLRVNLDLSLISPLNRSLSLEGTYKNYNSTTPFLGVWEDIFPHSNFSSYILENGEPANEKTHEHQNPLQIGLQFSASYSF